MPGWATELPVTDGAMGIAKRRLLSVRVAPSWAGDQPQRIYGCAPEGKKCGRCIVLPVVYLIGKASLYDGGMTDDEDGYLDSRCSPRSAGVSFGLAEFGRGSVESVKRIS